MKRHIHPVDFFNSSHLRHGLSCLFAIISFTIVWAMFRHPAKIESVTQPAPPIGREDGWSVAQRVAGHHLLGDLAAVTDGNTAASGLPDVELHGLIYSDEKSAALAIVEVSGTSGYFRLGDALPDGEEVTDVTPSSIELRVGSTSRVIILEQRYGGPTSGIMLAGDPDVLNSLRGLQGGGGAPNYAPVLRPVSLPRGGSTLSRLRALRQQLIKH